MIKGIERVTIPESYSSSLTIAQLLGFICPSLVKGIKELKVSVENTLPKKLLRMEEIQVLFIFFVFSSSFF